MTESEKLEEALCFATEKHKGQARIGGKPYITHPIEVCNIVKENGGDIDYLITALFHDLLEDTDATESEILKLGGEKVLTAVKLLTKQKGYVMSEYIKGIKENEIAFMVKAADRLHNLKCAVVADAEFKKKYISETVDWYLDFGLGIPEALKALAESMDNPIK